MKHFWMMIFAVSLSTIATADEPPFPRVAMLWSPAEGEGSRWERSARYGVIVCGPGSLGLRWSKQEFQDLADRIEPTSIPQARATLQQLQERNPRAVVCVELYFFEANTDAYPDDSPWWYRDRDGKKVSFWKGCYNMDVNNEEYIEHVARRIEAVHQALDGQAGLFLDNLRFDRRAREGWTSLLSKVRERCGDIPILVNSGWASTNLDWVAPWINGIMYEDSVAHTRDGDTEAFYGRVQAHWQQLRTPRISVNEAFGARDDETLMRRELVRTLVYTDAYYLYADSTYGHRHSWRLEWDAPLGLPLEAPAVPEPRRLARREFEGGTVLWLPETATKAVTISFEESPRWRPGQDKPIRTLTLEPGSGDLLLKEAATTQTDF